VGGFNAFSRHAPASTGQAGPPTSVFCLRRIFSAWPSGLLSSSIFMAEDPLATPLRRITRSRSERTRRAPIWPGLDRSGGYKLAIFMIGGAIAGAFSGLLFANSCSSARRFSLPVSGQNHHLDHHRRPGPLIVPVTAAA